MAHSVCPWWIGYLLASPIRRFAQDPHAILADWVKPGMTALEPGPGMGFFTLELARLVGPSGRVVAVDVQQRMLDGLVRRAAKAGLAGRIEPRLAAADSLGVDDLTGQVGFVLAFAVVHELPDAGSFFQQCRRALAPDGRMLVAEPTGHVSEQAMGETLRLAARAGLAVAARPAIRRSRSALLVCGAA